MTWSEVMVLGIVQGLTEFLPVSSSAHLRITSAIFFDRDAGASFTAVTQLGTEAAVLLYFAKDLWRIASAWAMGLFDKERRDQDYRMGWYIGLGTIPIGVFGLLFKDEIRSGARNLWLVGSTLIIFAIILGVAEKVGAKERPLERFGVKDAVGMGAAQAMALVPGVSRSGGTTTAGLFLGLTREAATRYSFLLAIPAVVLSGLFELENVFNPEQGGIAPSGLQMGVATLVAFGLGYASIAWLLGYVAKHTMYVFVGYRIVLGLLVFGLLAANVISAT
ncbi:undecaprenyl-diphosphate phosphatase [Virgisporangium aliadipatigenens]|nr:undecaprenyl-diphosphate phosphatase [Virgisporangium aliadipatigenens]